MKNTNTQYMRSVNDYSLSAHEIFNEATESRFPTHTRVATARNITAEAFPEAVETVLKQFTDAGYETTRQYNIDYDDGSEPGEESQYTIYEQKFIVLQKKDDVTNLVRDNTTVVLELYRRNGELIILTLSPIQTKPYVDKACEIFRGKFKPKKKEKVFYTISQSSHGFELEEMNIPTVYDVEQVNWHYNDDFLPVHSLIHDAIDTNKKGLILMHGLPGAGKTSYIKQLISKGGVRKLVYIPPHLAASIASPAFISFVREKLKSCVLIIEDAEDILRDRESHVDATAVANLLNISDGILGDALNILIIATFNMDRQGIDKALLRKGRMLAEYKFGELTEDKANALVEKLFGEGAVLNLKKGEQRTLGNIFNMEQVQPRAKETPKVAFGFQPG